MPLLKMDKQGNLCEYGFGGLFDPIVNLVSGAGKGAVNYVKDAGGNIVDAVTGAVVWVKDAGGNFIDPITGVVSPSAMFSAVKTPEKTLTSFANFIPSALGIKTPVPIDVGTAVSAGLVDVVGVFADKKEAEQPTYQQDTVYVDAPAGTVPSNYTSMYPSSLTLDHPLTKIIPKGKK